MFQSTQAQISLMSSQSHKNKSAVIRVRTETSGDEPCVEIIAPSSFSSSSSSSKKALKRNENVVLHSLPSAKPLTSTAASRSYNLHATSTSLTDAVDNRSPYTRTVARAGGGNTKTATTSTEGNRLVGTYDLSSLELNANLRVSKHKYTNVQGRRINSSDTATSTTTTRRGNSFETQSSAEMEELSDEDKKVTQLLARRAAHLPGNNWCQDWLQFMTNNHPLCGLCFKHRLHPLGIEERFVMLVGSIAFGVTATNSVYLYYSTHELEVDHIVIHLTRLDKEIIVTYEMIALWTFGGVVHSMFDLFIWHLSACACFLPGGFFQKCWYLQKVGSYISIALVAVLVAVCSFVIVIRADYEDQDGKIGFSDLNYLLGYGVELGLVYAAYWPLMATILFSGIFSKCIPCVGRPNDLRRQLRERLQEEKEHAKRDEENRVEMY